MATVRRFALRLLNLFRGSRVERELTREIASHLALMEDDFRRRGLSEEEARLAARRAFGGVEQTKERHRDERSFAWIESLLSDLKFAIRSLVRRPGFAVAAVMTLALGIGAAIVVFSAFDALLLRPQPYPDPQALVWGWGTFSGGNMASVSPADFLDYRAQHGTFSALAAWTGAPRLTLTDVAEPTQVSVVSVSGNFFDVFGVAPLRGRTLRLDDENDPMPAVAVLSHGIWKRLFGAREDIIGSTLHVAGSNREITIVGVMPPTFAFPNLPNPPDTWMPISFANPRQHSRSAHYLRPVGRLKSGVNLSRAQADMNVIARRLEQAYPETNAGFGIRLVPLGRQFAPLLQLPLVALSAAVGLLLLLACANVANLILARGAGRQRELATRLALGAGRARLIRLLMSEAAILAVAGALAGVTLAYWVTGFLRSMPPLGGFVQLAGVSVDVRALIFALAVSVGTALLVGVFPALLATRKDTLDTIRSGSGLLAGRSQRLPSRLLVVLEVALSLVLLVGAGLTLRSFLHLVAVDPGFNAEGVLTVRIAPSGIDSPAARRTYYAELLNQVRTIPGIAASSLVSRLVYRELEDWYFEIDGRPFASPREHPTAFYEQVSDGYFRTMGVPLRRGRDFTPDEVHQTAPVAVVDEQMAGRFFRGEDPIGKRILVYADPRAKHAYEIIGVAGSVRPSPAGDLFPTVYIPNTQNSVGMTLIVKAMAASGSVVNSLRNTLRAADKNLPLSQITPMTDVVNTSVSGERTATVVASVFSSIGLGLAALGLYGILAFSTARRTNEIGLRMALGSTERGVLRLIVGEGMRMSLVGLSIGLIGAFAVSRLLRGLLIGIPPIDPVAFVAATLVLVLVALGASYVPARRAAHIDPAQALRHE